jgi:hypothetical protein
MYVKYKSCTAQEYSNALSQGTLDAGTLYIVTTAGGLGDTSPTVRAELYIGNRKVVEDIAAPIIAMIQVLDAALNGLNGNVEAINVDNTGDVHCKSIDVDNLPKVCGYPAIIIKQNSPDVIPDFVGQFYFDSYNKNVYFGAGVASVSDFIRLNN